MSHLYRVAAEISIIVFRVSEVFDSRRAQDQGANDQGVPSQHAGGPVRSMSGPARADTEKAFRAAVVLLA